MRKAFAFLAIGILLMSTISGFSVAADAIGSFSVAASQPSWLPVPRNQTLVLEQSGIGNIWDSWNPFVPGGENAWRMASVEWPWYFNDATGETLYLLITGWEYQNNYTKFILHVRPGVTWNDGQPFTARDIVFTINTMMNNSKLYGYAWCKEWIKSVTAPDNLTAVFELNKPNPRVQYQFKPWTSSLCADCIVAEHIWKGKDPETFKNHPPVWTGPYKLKAVYPDLRMFIWERRDDYWATKVLGIPLPEPKYICLREAPAIDAVYTDFIRGDADIVQLLPMDMLVRATQVNRNCSYVTFLDTPPTGWLINCAKYPLSLPDVRWAIALCMDRARLANAWILSPETPPTIPATHPFDDWATVNKFMWPDVFATYKLEYNLDKANKLLDDLNFTRGPDGIRVTPNGTRLSWTVISNRGPGDHIYDSVLTISLELKKVGIEIYSVKSLPWGPCSELGRKGLYDIWAYAHGASGSLLRTGDIYFLLEPYHSKYAAVPIGDPVPGWVMSTRLSDPELSAVIDNISAIGTDHPNYMTLAKQGMTLWMKNLPFIPIVQYTFTVMFQKTYWTNWPEKGNYYAMPATWWWEFGPLVLPKLKSTYTPPPVTYVTVYAVKNVAAFKGADGKTYGPYITGDAMVLIPKTDADRLISEGSASYTPPPNPALVAAVNAIQTATARIEAALSALSSLMYAIIGLQVIVLIVVIVVVVTVMRKKPA